MCGGEQKVFHGAVRILALQSYLDGRMQIMSIKTHVNAVLTFTAVNSEKILGQKCVIFVFYWAYSNVLIFLFDVGIVMLYLLLCYYLTCISFENCKQI